MFFEIANLTLSAITLIVLIIYAYFTYVIAKDTTEPVASFHFNQYLKSTQLNFYIRNNSKIEIEVWGKIFVKNGDLIFQDKSGFYGNKSSWILQPFTDGEGHIDLKNLTNEKGIKLDTFINDGRIKNANIIFQIKYRKVGSKQWKKSSVQKYFFDFEKGLFWLNV